MHVRCEVRPMGMTLEVKKESKVTPSSECNFIVTLTKAARTQGEIEIATNKPVSVHFHCEGETLKKVHSLSLRY